MTKPQRAVVDETIGATILIHMGGVELFVRRLVLLLPSRNQGTVFRGTR